MAGMVLTVAVWLADLIHGCDILDNLPLRALGVRTVLVCLGFLVRGGTSKEESPKRVSEMEVSQAGYLFKYGGKLSSS